MASEFVVGVEIDSSGVKQGLIGGQQAVEEFTDRVDRAAAAADRASKAVDLYGESNRRQNAIATQNLRTLQQEAQALMQMFQAAQQGAAALEALAQRQEIEKELADAGVSAQSLLGQAITAQVAIRQRLTAAIADSKAEMEQSNQVDANVEGLRARTAALEDELVLLKLTGDARREYAAAAEEARAISDAGATPGTSQAASVQAEIAEQQRLREELGAVAAARELDAQRAAAEAEASEKLGSSLSAISNETRQTQLLTAAERQGAEAVAALNRQLEVEDALIRAGVAEIDSMGQLVVIEEEGAAAVRAKVAALQQEQAALAEVRGANAAAAAEGFSLWTLLGSAMDAVLQGLKYIVVYAGLFALGAKIKEAVESAFAFESSLTRLRTLVGTTAEEVNKIRTAIVGVSLATGQSADDNAKAMFAIESSGLRGEAAMRALQASAEGAAIGLGDQTTVARASVAAMVAYGQGNLSAKQALDVLIATAREGNTSVDQLAGAFGRVTGLAASVGVKFGDLGAAVATFTRVGVSADEAVTGLRGVLSALTLKEAKSAEGALKSVGFSVAGLREEIRDKGLAAALVDLVSRFDGNNDALAKVIPNIRALAEVMSNAKSQAGEYLGIQERVNAAIGHATDEAFEAEKHDPSFVWKQTSAALAEVGRAIGEDVLPLLVDVAVEIKKAVEDGALDSWAHGIATSFTVVVDVGHVVVSLLGQLPILLAAWVVWSVASGAAADVFSTAVTWLGVTLIDLEAAIAANPFGALAVVLLAVVAGVNAVATAQKEADQEWLNENARINADSVALAKLASQYEKTGQARKDFMGPTKGVSGPAVSQLPVDVGTFVLKGDSDFLAGMSKIQDAYKKSVDGANGDTTAVKAAELARQRDISALQAHTQAYLDDTQAAIGNREEMIKSQSVELTAAQQRLEADRQATGMSQAALDEAARTGNAPTVSRPLGNRGATMQVVDPNFAQWQRDDAAVKTLTNSITAQSKGLQAGKAMVTDYQTQLDKSRVTQESHTAATEKGSKATANFHLEIAKQIAVRQQEIDSAKTLAAAELQGGDAVRQATIEATANKLVVEAQQKAIKDHTTLRADEEAKIRSGVAALAAETQAVSVNTQIRASQIQSQQAELTGWAKIQDATSNTSIATLKLAAVLPIYAQAENDGIDITDQRIQQLKDEALARVEISEQVRIAAADAEEERTFLSDLGAAEATYKDAVGRSTEASREAALQKKVEAELKLNNIHLTAQSSDAEKTNAAVIESTVRAKEADIDRTKDRTVAQLALNKAIDAENQDKAHYADLTQLRLATAELGSDITSILDKYGLLSKASKDLEVQEAARAEYEAEHHNRTLAEITAEIQKRREDSDARAKEAADIEIARVKTHDLLTAWADVFSLMSAGFGGASTSMGRLTADMGKLVTAIQAVADAQGRANKLMAAAQVVSGLGAALADLNVGGAGKTGGPQALGGRLDGNYAGIGSIVGVIVGAIVGYFTAGVGTGAGAAIGTALGTVLGSIISKAGDSASAQLTAGGNVVVGESSRQLNGAVSDALTKIFKGLQLEFAKLGLLFQGAPLIDIKVRDNIVRVIVGNVVRTFSSMQDAISFAIAEALKQTATGGHLPPEVIAALKNTTATDLDALQSDIDFAFSIANYGVPKVVQAVDKSVSDFFVAMQRATSLGIDTTKVVAQFVDQIQAQKDAILQIDKTKSPADQMRADAAAFNQKMDLLAAQEAADLADLAIKKSDLEAKIALMKLSGDLTKDQLQQIADAQAALGSIDLAIAAAQGVLAGIVHISDQELADALARLGKGGKGGKGAGASGGSDPLGNLASMVADVGKAVRQSGMSDLAKQIDDIDEKWKKAIADVRVHANAQGEAERQHAAALAAANKLTGDARAAAIKAANDRYAKEEAGIAKTAAALAAANAARQQEIDLLKKDLDARVHDFTSKGVPGGDITSQIEGVDKTAQGLISDARTLYHAGGMTLQQLHETTAAIRAADAAQKEVIKNGVLKTVSDFLGGRGATGLLGNMADLQATGTGLTDNLQALADQGLISSDQLADLTQKIKDQTKAQTDALITNDANGLLSDLYGYLGMDKEAAQQKFDITIAELQARRAELAAAMETAHYTQDAMDKILGPIDALIDKVIAAGPSIFDNGGTGGGGGGTTTDNRTYAERQAADQAMFVNGQYVGSPSGGGANGGLSPADAQAQLQQYLDLGLNPMQVEINKVNDTFAKLRAVLGNTADVQRAYALAIQDILNKYLQPIRDELNSLATSDLSPLTAQQKFQHAQDDFMHAAQAIQGGDLSQLSQIPALAQGLLQQAMAVLPAGSEAYRQIFADVNRILNNILTQYGGGAPATGAGAGAGGSSTTPPVILPQVPGTGPGTVPTVDLGPLANQIAQGSADQVVELRKISTNTMATQQAVVNLQARINQGVTVYQRAS